MITTFSTLDVAQRLVILEVHISPDTTSSSGMYEEFIQDFRRGLNAAAIIIPAPQADGHVKFRVELKALSLQKTEGHPEQPIVKPPVVVKPELPTKPVQPIAEPPKLTPAEAFKLKMAQDKNPPTVLGRPVPPVPKKK